jgi:hypothetical protein
MLKRLFFATAIALLAAGGWLAHARAFRSRMNNLPDVTLWAWQRPERFMYIDTHRSAVAVLAETITLSTPSIRVEPRLQPASMPAGTQDIAVFRLQVPAGTNLNEPTRAQAAEEISKYAEYVKPKAVQIDFDATVSQREFYRALLKDLRTRLPKDVPLSMTALVSWCAGDDWISDLPVDEAVPMYFRMGVDNDNIHRSHMDVRALHEPLCRNSVGVSLDEPWPRFDYDVRVYAFAPTPWTEADYHRILERLAR